MDDAVVRRLVEINSIFYESLAEPFSESRSAPQPGYPALLTYIPKQPASVLDVGCGNGRFGRFLAGAGALETYSGLDYSRSLLDDARAVFPNVFFRDLSLPGCLDGFGKYDLVVCLSALQHIPAEHNRIRLLHEMADHLNPDGRIILANWQFLDSPRQRRKIQPWSAMGIDPGQLEADDYLVSWRRGGHGYRYVAYIDETKMKRMAELAGLSIVDQFRSDGLEGNLNLYSILK